MYRLLKNVGPSEDAVMVIARAALNRSSLGNYVYCKSTERLPTLRQTPKEHKGALQPYSRGSCFAIPNAKMLQLNAIRKSSYNLWAPFGSLRTIWNF